MSFPWQKTAGSVEPGIDKIKHIIAIASGKGGVGKSTVTVNLAVALQRRGLTVGLLDADIYGPSQPGMLGSGRQQPNMADNRLFPISRHGISFISMGLLLADDGPVIWRAPMAMKMIHQFLGSVVWGELDYLLIDLPPGTGDVQLTLAQQASMGGAVIVTTPQEVAVGVARKGLRMFEQVKVPILGIIENMSGFTCKHCGKSTGIFGEGGGRSMADEFGVPFLGSLPLDVEIMSGGNSGEPVLTKSVDSDAAKALISITDSFVESVEKVENILGETEPRSVEETAEGGLSIVWPDDHRGVHSAYHLRVSCPCAECIDEDTGKRTLDPKVVPLDISMKGHNPVGRYGLAIGFSDGHNSGIYSFELLRKLCECESCTSGSKDKQAPFSI